MPSLNVRRHGLEYCDGEYTRFMNIVIANKRSWSDGFALDFWSFDEDVDPPDQLLRGAAQPD